MKEKPRPIKGWTLDTTAGIEIGAPVSVSVELPSGVTICVDGEVVDVFVPPGTRSTEAVSEAEREAVD